VAILERAIRNIELIGHDLDTRKELFLRVRETRDMTSISWELLPGHK
jgi:hypothetical protein